MPKQKMQRFKNIKRIRKEKGFSLEKVATAVGISKQALSKMERGECTLSAIRLKQIAQALGVTADALLGNDSGRVYCRRCGNWFVPMGEKDMKELYYCPYCGDKNFTKEKGDINC